MQNGNDTPLTIDDNVEYFTGAKGYFVQPVEMVRTFETSLNTLGVKNEIYIYPGVGHAFANPSGTNYASEETRDAWNKTLSFLGTHLK